MNEAFDRIVARASSLWEHSRPDDPEVLARWRERAVSGDEGAFAKRLSWLPDEPVDAVLPEWPDFLARALESKPVRRISNHPFGSVLSGFVSAASEQLATECAEVFTAAAIAQFEDSLAADLSYLASPSLYLEFSVFREGCGGSGSPEDCGLYEDFAAQVEDGGWIDFFLEYSALARLLSVTALQWARNLSELAGYLVDDSVALAAFGGGRATGKVADVKPALSDSHDSGRRVALLRFESGMQVIYKPRNIGVEKAWFDLLAALNGHGAEFRILHVLDCGTHGWVEVVKRAPCRDEAEVRRFYERAGMLLCVLFALEASDCFYENIIAEGDWPVLVDMETLMHHVLRQADSLTPADAAADDILFDSVLRAGFLPAWESGADGTCVDISGLGATAGQVTPYQKRTWEYVNRDGMRLRHEKLLVPTEDHLPAMEGRSLRAVDYTAQIVDGFRRLYRLLVECRDELTAPGGHLEALGRQEIRFVFHATRIYGLLLKRLAAPRHMRSGMDRSIEIDILSRFYVGHPQKERFQAVLEAEIAALENLDIPRFEVMADSRDLYLPTGRTLEDAFEKTAVERVRDRLAALSNADMELQVELIRASLQASAVSVRHDAAASAEPASAASGRTFDTGEFIAEAMRIAAELRRRAIRSNDGGLTWIAPQLLPGTSHHQLRPLRMDLYNGLPGIALFFAGMERVVGTGRQEALAALLPVRRFLASTEPRRMAREGYSIGAATGIGSMVYALCRCGALLGEQDLLQDAALAAHIIMPEWIAEDQAFDVMSGSAGAILGLLALDGDGPLDAAVRCGRHLLACREAAGPGAAWRTGHGRFMTGFSHGAAGIALALLRLARVSGDTEFESAAEEAIAFENSCFDRHERNWPDFRYHSEERPAFMNTWCHGAAGIGMARLAGGQQPHCPDVEAALDSVWHDGIGGKDGLCCGNLGRAELPFFAEQLDPPRNGGRRACDLASAVVERARREGGFRLSGRPGQDFFDPSFFQGLAGIGYQLLRMSQPSLLPSVLVWQ